MENKNRRNKKNVIIYLVFVLLLSFNIFIYFEIKSLSREYINLDKIYEEKKTFYNQKENETLKIADQIKQIEDLDNNFEEIKKEYFSNIKKLEDEILAGNSNQKIAYLTFDDGPYYNTYNFLDILDKYNVKATFFTTSINGDNCYDRKSENCLLLYKEYLKRGHTIANHTFTHGIRRGLYNSTETFMTAVKNQEERVKAQTGYVTNIVRFPGGSVTAGKLKNEIIEELRKNNYGWVDWTAQDGDGGSLETKEQAWNIFTSSINENIEVILFHDYNNITLSILPDAIEYLQNNGYILLPLFYESNMVNK